MHLKDQQTTYNRQYYEKNHDKIRIQQRKWHSTRRGYSTPGTRRRRYGLTQVQYDILMLTQCGKCAICTEVMEPSYVDHDHETGRIRGLLCRHCNTGLGCFKDNPELLVTAGEYLR